MEKIEARLILSNRLINDLYQYSGGVLDLCSDEHNLIMDKIVELINLTSVDFKESEIDELFVKYENEFKEWKELC